MLITRFPIETELADRVGGLLTLVNKIIQPTGATATYTGAIAFAMQALGYTTMTAGVVLDSDLAPINGSLFYSLCDLGEYRLIKTGVSNFTDPNQTLSLERQDWNDVMKRFEARLDALGVQYAAFLNIRRMPTVVGQIRSHFPVPGRRDWGLGHGRSDH